MNVCKYVQTKHEYIQMCFSLKTYYKYVVEKLCDHELISACAYVSMKISLYWVSIHFGKCVSMQA